MGTVIGITGTPGTGKKSVAPLVASLLGLAHVALPRLPGGAAPAGAAGEVLVDTAKARRELERHPLRDIVAYGHILPYILPPGSVDRMVVLRCEPMVLKRRLSQRGYSFEKTIQNVEAELIGVIASDATSAFGKGKTMEFDTSASSAAESAKAIARMVQEQKPTGTRIDWMPSYGSARKLRALLDPEVLVRD